MTQHARPGLGMPQLGPARAANEKISYKHEQYPAGAPGIKRSLDEMARLMREARLDKDVVGYSADVLRAAGIDGRDAGARTARRVAQAMLDNVRSVTVYMPDPNGAEYIVSPAGMLCLRPGLCIRREDCDGLTTLLGSLILCCGFNVRIVKQSWGPAHQEHVLVEVQDEDGTWLKADPSHPNLPVGRGVPAQSEEHRDPMDVVGSVGTAGAELVTLGAFPTRPRMRPVQRRAQINDQLMPARRGLGLADPYASTQSPLSAMVSTIGAADTYLAASEYSNAVTAYQAAGTAGATVVGPSIDLSGAPNVTQPITQQAWQINGMLAMIAPATATVSSATQAQTYARQMLTLYQNAVKAGTAAQQNPSAPPGGGPSGGPATAPGPLALYVLGGGVVAGIAYELLQRRRAKPASGARK